MSKCRQCGREMLKAAGCDKKKFPYVSFGKSIYKRLPRPLASTGRCHDCGALPGGLHHEGCDMERCPRCGGQLLSCSCNDKGKSYVGSLAVLLKHPGFHLGKNKKGIRGW